MEPSLVAVALMAMTAFMLMKDAHDAYEEESSALLNLAMPAAVVEGTAVLSSAILSVSKRKPSNNVLPLYCA
jgi:hypothetical protein